MEYKKFIRCGNRDVELQDTRLEWDKVSGAIHVVHNDDSHAYANDVVSLSDIELVNSDANYVYNRLKQLVSEGIIKEEKAEEIIKQIFVE